MVKEALRDVKEYVPPDPRITKKQAEESFKTVIETFEKRGMNLEDMRELFDLQIEAKQALRSFSPLGVVAT